MNTAPHTERNLKSSSQRKLIRHALLDYDSRIGEPKTVKAPDRCCVPHSNHHHRPPRERTIRVLTYTGSPQQRV